MTSKGLSWATSNWPAGPYCPRPSFVIAPWAACGPIALPAYRRHDPHDLLAMLDVWLAFDVARAAGLASGDEQADLAGALGRVRARTTVVACGQDLYYPPED